MPAGLPYFAWVDASETTWQSDVHMRWDEAVFSFTLKQGEGDPASLTVVVRRPRNVAGDPIGLLGPGRKIWAWFALDCGPALIKFRGRLVGIPTSLFEELVTLEFVARPIDVVAQKEALANTLRVLPHYDEAVIDPARRSDPDVVLEGYTKIWHYDRETHVVTVSDEITGEDGLVQFDGTSDDGAVLYDGLSLTLTSGPLARVDVNAEYTWTQQAGGTVDLTGYLLSHWPGVTNGIINSYTLAASDWPKNGAGIGDGWVVAESSAYDLFDFTVKSKTEGLTLIVKWADGDSSRATYTQTTSYGGGHSNIGVGGIVTADDIHVSYSHDGDGLLYTSSFSRNFSSVNSAISLQAVQATLVAGYTAGRPYTERVSFSLFADVQPILTDPEDGEALRIDDVKSINLTEGGMIGDPRRRSYIATDRGNRSLEHLIALARAKLMMRARAVEIAFAPKLARMPEITLRKNVFLIEPRIGEATGKIIGYSLALDGSDGRINCEVRIGCPIGRGGTVATTAGTPSYCVTAYVGADYQQFVGRTVVPTDFDSSVGYHPPGAAPNDDGINFLSVLRAEDVIETGLVVEFGPDEQEAALNDNVVKGQGATSTNSSDSAFKAAAEAAVAARTEYLKNLLKQYETRATFKLKSMTREFSSDYVLQVTDLKIPTGYDLEAV